MTSDDQILRSRLWRDGVLEAEDFPFERTSDYLGQEGCLVWVDLCAPDPAHLSELAQELALDPLAVEDALARQERVKSIRYATHTFLTVYATSLADRDASPALRESGLRISRISVFVLPRGIVAVRQGPGFDIDEVVKHVRELKVGGDDGHLGAMTSPQQVTIVRDHLEDAVAKGAKVLTGGPDAISGQYIQPTVLTGVDHRMKVMTEETFGPVLPIAKVRSLDEAVQLANDSKYGLGSSVFAGKAARSIADKLRAGMTSINSVMAFAGIPSLPFGGIGDSGFGRIHGEEGIREFTRIKSTAEQAFSLPMNMMSFRQPKDMTKRLRGMIKQLYGQGVVSRAGDVLRKLRK